MRAARRKKVERQVRDVAQAWIVEVHLAPVRQVQAQGDEGFALQGFS
ncbi:MAG: hypothetical protein FLDDKLPJ_02006 [Phycisphaerae bacterium]|nr:hypothetical protein [Phycisphaerae bacterium]